MGTCFPHYNLAQNPSLVMDVNTSLDLVTSFPGGMVERDGILYFNVKDNDGIYLWRTDGTAQGTYRAVKPGFYEPSYSDAPMEALDVNGILFYRSSLQFDYKGADALWKTDGTQQGTELLGSVKDPGNFVDFNGTVFFAGWDSAHGTALWKTDGTLEGTVLVNDKISGPEGYYSPLSAATVFNNKIVYFDGDELYTTDGSDSGTVFILISIIIYASAEI